jgi:hypothetical protein
MRHKKRALSPEGRQRIADAQRKRCATKKAKKYIRYSAPWAVQTPAVAPNMLDLSSPRQAIKFPLFHCGSPIACALVTANPRGSLAITCEAVDSLSIGRSIAFRRDLPFSTIGREFE